MYFFLIFTIFGYYAQKRTQNFYVMVQFGIDFISFSFFYFKPQNIVVI